jgi:hypothetical protein
MWQPRCLTVCYKDSFALCVHTHTHTHIYCILLMGSLLKSKSEIKNAIDGNEERNSTEVSSIDLSAQSAGYCFLLLWQHCSVKSMFTEFTTVSTALPIKCGLSTTRNLAIGCCVHMLFGGTWVNSWHHLCRVLIYFANLFHKLLLSVKVSWNIPVNY